MLSEPLQAGKTYTLLVTGTFAYNAAAARSDGFDLLLDGQRIASQKSPDHRYCMDLLGSGEALSFHVADSHTTDNDGALTVWIGEKR